METNRDYYVYSHHIPGEKLPFYIGMGCGNRAWDTSGRNKLWKYMVEQNGIEVKILCNNISVVSAAIIEEQLIREYGRKDNGTGILVNMTDGGEGCSGHSEETKRVISEKSKRMWEDDEFRKRMLEIRRRQKPKNPKLAGIKKSIAATGGKLYTLTDPDGKDYSFINQAEFARTHGFSKNHLSSFLKGKYKYGKTYKGWSVKNVRQLTEEDYSIYLNG